MKLRVVLDVEVSETLAETMQRAGFTVCPDGSKMQVRIQNSPAVPNRKVKIEFFKNFTDIKDVGLIDASK